MEGTTNGYSLSDIASVMGDNGFGGGGAWVLIILFALIFGGNGLFGGNSNGTTASDAVQRAVDLNSIQEGQAGISADVQRGIYEINGATKDASYNNLGEIRDVQASVATGNANLINNLTALQANMQSCCCETKQMVLENRYLASQNTASINENTTAQAQKILDAITTNRMADMQSQINNLQLQNALSGVMKYPMSTSYTAGLPLYANSCNCNGNV